LPVALLVFNAFIWGVSWWPFRQLNALGLHSLWATGFAFAFATLLITLWRPGAWRALVASPGLAWLVRRLRRHRTVAFNWGVMIGEVVRVVLLFYLMPVWAALLARWLLGERITAAILGRIALALAGAAIVLHQPGMGVPLPSSLADWLGLSGGVAFATVNVLLRRNAAASDEARTLALFVGGGAVALPLAALLASSGAIATVPAPAPAWIAGTAALALALLAGNVALQHAAARLPASVTALVMLSEIVFAALSSVWLGGETMTPRTLAGGAMIVLAAALAAMPRRARP